MNASGNGCCKEKLMEVTPQFDTLALAQTYKGRSWRA